MDNVRLFYDLNHIFDIEFQLSNFSGYTVVFRIEQNKNFDYDNPKDNHVTLTIAKYFQKPSDICSFSLEPENNILEFKKTMSEKEFMIFKKELFSKCNINEWAAKYNISDTALNMLNSNSVKWHFRTDNGYSIAAYDEFPSDFEEMLRCINDTIRFSGVEISSKSQNLETSDDIRSVAPVKNIIDSIGKKYTRPVRKFEFFIGSYGTVSFSMNITQSNGRFFLNVFNIVPYRVFEGGGKTSSFKIMISDKEMKDIIKALINKHRILNWNKEYKPPGIVCDGTGWSVLLEFDDGEIFESYGRNAYPNEFKRFLTYINHIVRFSGLKFC